MRISIPIVCLVLVGLSACKGDDPGGTPGGSSFASADPAGDAEQSDRPVLLYRHDFARLVRDSPLVFLASLAGRIAERDERGLIVTRNDFDIEQVIRGERNDTAITLSTLGGTLGDETLTVSHMPAFRDGWRYVVFTDPQRTTYDPVTGNQDGVFVVGADGGVYTYQGVGVSGIEGGRLQLGAAVLSKLDQPDREEPTVLYEDPDADGEIVAIEPAEAPSREIIQLTEFIDSIRQLADLEEDPS